MHEVISVFLYLLNFLSESMRLFVEALGQCAIARVRQCEILSDRKPNSHSHSIHKNPAVLDVCGHKQSYDFLKLQF
jgi:hypothetical protein